MKIPILLLTTLGWSIGPPAFCQQMAPPQIEWQRSFGGQAADSLWSLKQTADGGYILAGGSRSLPGGNKSSSNFGGEDFWLVRLGGNGEMVWEKSFGGRSNDFAFCVQEVADGGFVLGGRSESPVSGNKTSQNYGKSDFWFVRVDTNGNKVWDKSYGGAGIDALYDLQQTSDGGYVLVGVSSSQIGGNKASANYGGGDFWIVRLDSVGNLLWDRTVGGTGEDSINSVQQTADGGFILAGVSTSPPDGSKTSTHFGRSDFWLVLLSTNGVTVWNRSFGGTLDDQPSRILQTTDGGFIAAGTSDSPPDGNKTSPHFGTYADGWVVRINTNGNALWDQTFGGTREDSIRSLEPTSDGGFVLGGSSISSAALSVDGGTKLSTNYGYWDFWVTRLDADGHQLWDQSFGGNSEDVLLRLQQAADGGFIIGGYSSSPTNGNKTAASLGSEDFWILKLKPEDTAVKLRVLPQFYEDLQHTGYRFLFYPGIANRLYAVEHSTDLVNWVPALAFQVTSYREIEILDPSSTNSMQRFYRARRLP